LPERHQFHLAFRYPEPRIRRHTPMGLFDRSKPEEDQDPQADWLAERARVANFLYRARNFAGTGPEDPTLAVKLRPDERALLVATGTYLVKPRRLKAHWRGAPGGLTFAVTRLSGPGAGFEPVTDRGLAPLDSGDLTFTTKRVVFSGSAQTVDWEYANLLGFDHLDRPSSTTIVTTDHERPTGFVYDPGQAEEIRFAIALGIAKFYGDLDSLLADLQSQLDEIDRDHPSARPADQPVAANAPPAPVPPAPVPPAAAPAPAPAPSPSPFGGMPAQPIAVPEPAPVSAEAVTPEPEPEPTPEPTVAEAATPEALRPEPVTPEPVVPEPVLSESVVPEPAAVDAAAPADPEPSYGSVSASAQTDQPDTILPSSPPLTWGSGADLGPTLTSLAPEAGRQGGLAPNGRDDEASPTGEIPEVKISPTAMYPAVSGQQYTGASQGGQYGQAVGAQYAQGAAQQQPAQGAGQTAQTGTGQTGTGQTGTGQQMPPGWYPDPWRIARVRWWDGYAWTAYTSH
jgi:hypothetical protein